MNIRNFFTILLFGISCFMPAFAQIKQISEDEVNTQKVFIEATKEKLLGNYENAATLFKEVLKRDKKNHVAAYELARIYHVLEKNDKALQSIKLAVANDPQNDWYQLFLADMEEQSGNPKSAAKIYEKLLKDNPKDAYFYEKLAFLYVKSGKPEKGVDVFNKMEEAFGIHEDISKRKHRLYLGMGDKEKAAGELERLIRYAPSNTDYYHLLAGFHTQMGDVEKADEVYRRILEVDPADVKASIALAGKNNSSADGNDLGYLASLKPLFQKDDVNIDLKIKELYPFIEKVAYGKTDEPTKDAVLDLAQTMETVHPKEAKAFSAHADLLYYTGNKKLALEKYTSALSLNKSVFSVYEQIMYIHAESGNFDELLSISENALDRFPNKASGFYFNGLALSNTNKPKDALNSFNQALLMSRKNPALQVDLHNQIAGTYASMGKVEKADQSFEKALKVNPDAPEVLNHYSAYLAARNEKLDKAKAMSARANELIPNQALFQDTYGWILYQMKEYKSAKDWIGKALDNGGENLPGILEHYGDVMFQLNDTEEAVNYWQKSLDKGSKNPLLEKKIAARKIVE